MKFQWPQRKEAVMPASKEAGPKPGTRTCPKCEGEQGTWVGQFWFWCDYCSTTGWVKL